MKSQLGVNYSKVLGYLEDIDLLKINDPDTVTLLKTIVKLAYYAGRADGGKEILNVSAKNT